MTIPADLEPAAQQLTTLLDGVRDDQLSAPTPCAGYTVGDLLDHLMGLTVAFRHAAAKTAVPGQSGPPEVSAAHLHPGWRARLPVQLDDLVTAWRDPAAWQDTTEAGGVSLPAEVMGRVALNELVLHGWDLARGTGQPFECDPVSAQVCHELVSAITAPGQERPEGLFADPVPVPPDAPLLHRLLGLSGRDPGWVSAQPAG